jgi:hypothetical protein
MILKTKIVIAISAKCDNFQNSNMTIFFVIMIPCQ